MYFSVFLLSSRVPFFLQSCHFCFFWPRYFHVHMCPRVAMYTIGHRAYIPHLHSSTKKTITLLPLFVFFAVVVFLFLFYGASLPLLLHERMLRYPRGCAWSTRQWATARHTPKYQYPAACLPTAHPSGGCHYHVITNSSGYNSVLFFFFSFSSWGKNEMVLSHETF